jgi:hypothetical protein
MEEAARDRCNHGRCLADNAKWRQCNGRQLQNLAQAALFWLEKHHEYVNSLNVFPVPDGDTGTNMLLTMRSAYNRIKDKDDLRVGRIAESFAHGALMGARAQFRGDFEPDPARLGARV